MVYDILIAPSSFGECGDAPLQLLMRAGFSYALNPFKRKLTEQELVGLARNCRGIVAGVEVYSAKVLDQCPKLKCISRCGTGLDSVDVEQTNARGIEVCNTPDAPTDAVAELTVGLIIAVLRRITLADSSVRGGGWNKYIGPLVRNKTIGIIGYGRIGQRVVQLLEAFGASFLLYDPMVSVTQVDRKIQSVPLRQLLQESDIVTLHLSWDKRKPYLIGWEELDVMKKGSYLINLARGGVVDEKALYEKLKSKHLDGAALDVFEQEPYAGDLATLDNVVLTPHMGSYAREARLRMETEAVENLINYLSQSTHVS